MENIVKQIQLLALVIILIATIIAFGIEVYQMISIQKVTLADLLLQEECYPRAQVKVLWAG